MSTVLNILLWSRADSKLYTIGDSFLNRSLLQVDIGILAVINSLVFNYLVVDEARYLRPALM